MEEAEFESTIRRIDDEEIDLEDPEEVTPEFLRERAFLSCRGPMNLCGMNCPPSGEPRFICL